MCNWHWAIRHGDEYLCSLAYGGGLSADLVSERKALKQAIRHAAGATNRNRSEREQIRIERCSCNGVHETVYPFLDGGVVEPEHLWAQTDPWYLDEDDLVQPLYSLWSAKAQATVASELTHAEAVARAKAAANDLIVLKQPPGSESLLVVFDKTGGAFFRAQRLPLSAWLERTR